MVLFFGLAFLSESGQAPGLTQGQLTPCPNKPNCVCTEYPNDTAHFSTPITLTDNSVEQAHKAIMAVLTAQQAVIESQQEHYISATFHSDFFGFADDVEFRIAPDQAAIHIRSAARVGHSDFGVNAERVQTLKADIEQQLNQQ